MKKAVLWILGSFAVFAVLLTLWLAIAFFSAVGSAPTNSADAETKVTEKESKPKVDMKSEYDKIVAGNISTGEGGTGYFEVVKALGKPTSRTEVNTTGMNGEPTIEVYANWYSPTQGSLSVTFVNDKVSYKSLTK